jgi:hypothetical protein
MNHSSAARPASGTREADRRFARLWFCFRSAASRATGRRFDRRGISVRPRPAFRDKVVRVFSLVAFVLVLSTLSRSSGAEPSSDVPALLRAHVGEGEGQIARPVLQRARALYLRKVREGAVKNDCYLAMDATRPNDLGGGRLGDRFYIVCEASRSFRAIPAGHGSGRNVKGVANFANGRRCAKNFGNAMDSYLTTGGDYITAEIKSSFKGYYRVPPQTIRRLSYARPFSLTEKAILQTPENARSAGMRPSR